MAISRGTLWRTAGDVPMGTWQRVINNAGGPEGLIRPEAWASARPHSALCLAMLRMESSYGVNFDANPASSRNPLNLKDRVKGGYAQYPTWADGIAGWRSRITSDEYPDGQGIYYRTKTIAELIHVYAPSYDQTKTTTEKYITEILRLMNSWGQSVPPGEDERSMALTFKKVPHPAHTKMIVNKAGGGGFDWVQPRQIVGGVHHETLGLGSGPWYAGFFGCPSGERCRNALVDYVIEKDGDIYMLNDPRGTRSPWASGGGVGLPGGLEGDGPAFVAKFGINAINGRNVSIEYVKLDTENFTDAQVQAGGALMAYWHDQDGQPWEQHPFVPKYGIVCSFLHFEFGTTSCGKGEQDDISRVQAVTKGIMKKYQTSGDGAPVPPDVPTQPPVTIPGGLTLADAKKRFGSATRHTGNTTKGGYGFDITGPISLAWAHRAAVEKTWPACEDIYVLEDSGNVLQLVTFSNDWRLAQVAERSGWQWVSLNAVEIP